MILILNSGHSQHVAALCGENLFEYVPCASIGKLKENASSKDDIFIFDGDEVLPKTLNAKLSRIHAKIVLYDRNSENITPLMKYQHSVYLPYDYTKEELVEALRIAEETAKKIGTLEDILVGDSEKMRTLRTAIEKTARFGAKVLHIAGESGTGKNLVASYIHQSIFPRKNKYIYETCSALDGDIAESRFFGHAKDAYTGAAEKVDGIVASADGGSLFLDEVEDLSLAMQAKLLHLMETGEFRSIGDDKMHKSSFVLITASNINLKNLVESKRMRSDFYHRISGITIKMPSLKEHKEDIPRLVEIKEEVIGINVNERITDFSTFMKNDWDGNVRELFSAVERYHVGLAD